MTAATAQRRTRKPAKSKPKPARKNQFDPDKLEAEKPTAPAAPPADAESDPDRDAVNKSLAALQQERDRFKTQLESVLTWKKRLQVQQSKVSKARAGFDEADAQRKAAKAALDKAIADELSLVARFIHGEQCLPYEDAEAQQKTEDKPATPPAPAPVPQTTDEFGLLPLDQAKATLPGADKATKLPKGFIEKCSELDPAVTTVAQLEKLIGDGGLQKMKGVGQAMVDKVSDCVVAFRQEHPIPETADPAPESGPPPETQPGEWEQSAYHLRELLQQASTLANGATESVAAFCAQITTAAQQLLDTITAATSITTEQRAAIATWTAQVAHCAKTGEVPEPPEWETALSLLGQIALMAREFAALKDHAEFAKSVVDRAKTFTESITAEKAVNDVQREWIGEIDARLQDLAAAQAVVKRIEAVRDEASQLSQHGENDACEPCEQVMVAAVQALIVARKATTPAPEHLDALQAWETELAKWRKPAE
jgi:hypothetical protein